MKMKTTNDMHQVNGSHYENLKLEPVQLYQAVNQINWFQAEPIKYISRFWTKNGVTDLNKAKHILSMARDMEIRKPYELVIPTKFIKDYCVQFFTHFNKSKSNEINANYFGKFVSLIINILLGEWDRSLIYLDEIMYYFYGEEEQKICQ